MREVLISKKPTKGLECVCDRGSFRKRSLERFDCERSPQANPLLFHAVAHVEPDRVAPSNAVGKHFVAAPWKPPLMHCLNPDGGC